MNNKKIISEATKHTMFIQQMMLSGVSTMGRFQSPQSIWYCFDDVDENRCDTIIS
jgi:hypothetical protein